MGDAPRSELIFLPTGVPQQLRDDRISWFSLGFVTMMSFTEDGDYTRIGLLALPPLVAQLLGPCLGQWAVRNIANLAL